MAAPCIPTTCESLAKDRLLQTDTCIEPHVSSRIDYSPQSSASAAFLATRAVVVTCFYTDLVSGGNDGADRPANRVSYDH